MALSNVQKFGAAAAISLATIFGASQASAMETGCRDANAVRADLVAEQQIVLLSAVTGNGSFAQTRFTSNPTGTLGYRVVEGFGDAAGKFCVSKFTNIRVNNNSNFARPTWARFSASSEFGNWLSAQEAQNNVRVLLGANSVVKNDQGQEVAGGFVVVVSGDAVAGSERASIEIRNAGAIRITDTTGSRSSSLGTLYNVGVQQPNYSTFANRPILNASLD